jgi:hypothetical protein
MFVVASGLLGASFLDVERMACLFDEHVEPSVSAGRNLDALDLATHGSIPQRDPIVSWHPRVRAITRSAATTTARSGA